MIESGTGSFEALVRHADGAVETLDPARLDDIDRLAAADGSLVWVSAVAPDDVGIEILRREFNLHPLAVEDVRKQHQRPKLDAYPAGHMVVAYEAVEGQDLSEIHLFVGPAWLLTVSWSATPMVDAARERFANGGDRAARTIGRLLYSVIDAAVDSYFPELDRLSDRIDALESRVLEGDADPDSLREVLSIKRRLLELRRVLAPMRDVANQLLRRDLDIVDEASVPYYQDLYDHLVRVIDQLDVYRDLLATVLDARLTVASNSLNAIMKRLTAFTVILMVPTLIAGIYGMNFERMPELALPYGYPLALGVMVLAVIVGVTFFRRRGWF
ncbi:MAG TPA: magnesium/cobalt transporter CorA [Candidatus Limnocylindria bacterium]